jgi:dienelactone hydrolase
LVVLAAGCGPEVPSAAPYGPDVVQIPSIAVPEAWMPSGPIPAALKLPEGNGPFPAVIVLHGCGGRGASQLYWARHLNDWGYAALIPDSMTPRGVRLVCEPAAQKLMTPRDRLGDVGSAVAWLRTKPEIDPGRIAVLGLSHSGSTAVMATERRYASFGLRAAIDYYGPCADPAAHGTVPLIVLVGGADDWGHPALRCQAFGMALRAGLPFEIEIYPGVYHAFDNPDMVRSVSNEHVMEYNPAAAEDSFVLVHAFLDRWVRH